MAYAIEWTKRAAKALARLDAKLRARIVEAVEHLAATGDGDVRRLVDVDPPTWRLRVGEWRVLFRYEHERLVIVVLDVRPRSAGYD